jgi:AcrR family transcriptional regulator
MQTLSPPYPEANLDNPTVVKILRAAGREFARNGYDGTSLRQIADRAGVAKSLLHYHFKSKDHLLFELQAMMFREIAASVQSVGRGKAPALKQALAALDEAWRLIIAAKSYIPLFIDLWKLSATQSPLRGQQVALNQECHELVVAVIRETLGPIADRLVIAPPRLAELLLTTFAGMTFCLHVDEAAALRSFEDFKLLLINIVPREDRQDA